MSRASTSRPATPPARTPLLPRTALPTCPPAEARLRSGAAARMAGLPVATLRVWERRYAVIAAPKTATGQRLYSAQDVQRLRLLRQLSESGHAIGTIAPLGLPALQALARGSIEAETAERMPQRRLVVIGRSALQRLQALPDTEIVAMHESLDEAEAALRGAGRAEAAPGTDRAGPAADLLLVQTASLPPDAAERLSSLRQHWRAGSVLVLYAFAAESSVTRLRHLGLLVRREPLAVGELPRLVAAMAPLGSLATLAPLGPASAGTARGAEALTMADVLRVPPPPRRYSDEALATLAELPSAVACECPRHLAEILQQLVAFERYSADCRSLHPADAELHRALQALAASARVLFEEAVARVVAAEGLDLPAADTDTGAAASP